MTYFSLNNKINQTITIPIKLLRIKGDDMSMASILDEQHLAVIEKAVKEIQFGEIQITIQDGNIVQINRLEKHRFTKSPQIKPNKLTIK